jgi:hypothetical protein
VSAQYDEIDAFDAIRVVRELEALRGKEGWRAKAIRDTAKPRAQAVRDYERARARVRRATPGSAQAKDDAAILDDRVDHLRMAAEDAKSAEAYAKNLAKDHELDQSNLQSQLRLIERVLGIGGTNR